MAATLAWRTWDSRSISLGSEDHSLRSFFKPNLSLLWRGPYAGSLFSPWGLRRFLEEHLPVRRFEDLRVPLRITATDLDRGEVVLFGPHSGDLLSAILASCAVPGIFPPVTISGRRLADGGILSNLPLEVAVEAGATRVLAMECVCDDAYAERSHLTGMWESSIGTVVPSSTGADALQGA